MKKFIIFASLILVLFCLTSCSDKQNEKNEIAIPDDIDLSWYRDNNSAICSGLYIVGDDIGDGEYTITCTDRDSHMHIILFQSISNYLDFHKTVINTDNDKDIAINNTAIFETNLNINEACTLNLKNGNVLFIGYGSEKGTLCNNSKNVLTHSTNNELLQLYSGVHFSRDIKKGKYIMTGIANEGDWIKVIVFSSSNEYKLYLSEKGTTDYEMQRALEKHALSEYHLDNNENCYLNITDDAVVSVSSGGCVILEPVQMSWMP